MKRRILTFIFSAVMMLTLITPSFAVGINDVNSSARIRRETVEQLLNTKTCTRSFNGTPQMTDEIKQQFFDVIDRISELKVEKTMVGKNFTNRSVGQIDSEMAKLYAELKNMPVVEISPTAVASLSGRKPSVPGDTNYVHFYGMKTNRKVSGKNYEVFEIVAYSDLRYSNRNRPMYAFNDCVQLLGPETYTQAQFKKFIKFALDTATGGLADYAIPGSSIIATIADPYSFFGSSGNQSLELKYKANSYYTYSYVSAPENDWYQFMQTTERLKLDVLISAYSSNYVGREDEGILRKVEYSEGRHWNDTKRPAIRYANGETDQEAFPIGTKRIYYNNIHKETIGLDYYNSLESIPGI